jgi:2-oxoglutarate ferredoxin oxidoreductase subunit alpha
MAGFQIFGAGRAGDGTNTNTQILSQALKDLGAWTFQWREEVYSNIQTRDSVFGLRAADHPIFGPQDEIDILEAFDQGALEDVAGERRIPPIEHLRRGGALLYDSSARLEYPNTGHELKLDVVKDLLDERRIRVFGLPMGQWVKEHLSGSYIVRATIGVGAVAHMLGIPDDAVLGRFARRFGAGSQVYQLNEKAYMLGRDYAREQGWDLSDMRVSFKAIEGEDIRQTILGDEAVGAGAIVAGCRVYAGYPITPASEVLEYMAENLPRFGGAMIQADSEMAAAHHVIGAAVAGARSMTATSGPGFSLMQEAISAGGVTETPMVIVVCTRGGPGTGLPTRMGQEELNEAIFGGHGDFARIVLAASEPEDAFYIMEHVFNLAERYQCPVFLLIDQLLAQSSYTIPALDPSQFVIDRGKLLNAEQIQGRYGTNGASYQRHEITGDGISYRVIPGTPGITNYYTNTNEHTEDGYITEEETVRQLMTDKRYVQRTALIEKDRELPEARYYGDANARIGLIGYGTVYGPVLEAIERLGSEGIKAKYLELRTLWPFPGEEVRRFVESCDAVYIPEYSAGAQLRGLVQREATGPMPGKLHSILKYDGRLMTPGFIVKGVKGA